MPSRMHTAAKAGGGEGLREMQQQGALDRCNGAVTRHHARSVRAVKRCGQQQAALQHSGCMACRRKQ